MGFYPFRFGASSEVSNDWTRPSDWLPLPDIQPPTEGIAALVAVSEDGYSNLVSLKMTISDSATWTVDWGDGSTPEVIASGNTATHDYAWADVGNVTSEGWRQAVLTVYPATGKTFATINMAAPVGTGVRNTGWVSPIVDISCSASASTSMLCADTATRGGLARHLRILDFRSSASLTHFPKVSGASQLQILRRPAIVSAGASPYRAFLGARVPKSEPLDWLSGSVAGAFDCAIFENPDVVMDLGGRSILTASEFARYSTASSITIYNSGSGSSYQSNAFSYTYHLLSIVIDKVAGSAAYFLTSATRVQRVHIADASGITSTTSFFASVASLEELILTGLTIGISVADCNLGAAALDAFFTSLGTAAGAQTITITGNPGAGTCDTSIATAKGFTVVN